MKVRLRLELHSRDNKEIIDITQGATSITWSGDYKSPSRTLEFGVAQAVMDSQLETVGINEGDTVSFYVNEEEYFRGILIDVERRSSENEVRVVAKDIGFLLAKNKLAFNFKERKAEDVASDVIKKLGYKIGSLAKTNYKYSKVITGSSGYEIIQARYTEASKVTGKKYMTYANKDMYHVIEKGKEVMRLQFNEGENIVSSSYKISLENMVNKVIVTDSEGNEVSKEVDKDTLNLYKITVQEIRNQQAGGSGETGGKLKKPEKTASLTGWGNPTCRTGKAVLVKDTFTGLVGKFFIESDKHMWSGGDYQVEMGLNFENLMDEKEITEQAKGEASFGGTGGGILNGKTVNAEFTAYAPTGNPTANGEKTNPKANTCACPPEIPFNTQIQVSGTNTSWDGKTLRCNDRGGAIKIVNGIYHIDILMATESECRKFGRRRGKIVIGNGTGYSYPRGAGGGNQRAVQLAKSQLGKPYRWGATGPSSFDCSGLIFWVARKLGKSIPRTSREQSNYGQSVAKSNLLPGDCVFFGSPVHHVGMYVGSGKFIHAPKTGDVVKISSLSSRGDYHNARRFL